MLNSLNTRARRLKTGLACLVRARAGRLLNVYERVRFLKNSRRATKMNLQVAALFLQAGPS